MNRAAMFTKVDAVPILFVLENQPTIIVFCLILAWIITALRMHKNSIAFAAFRATVARHNGFDDSHDSHPAKHSARIRMVGFMTIDLQL